jgi:hypothetical protein
LSGRFGGNDFGNQNQDIGQRFDASFDDNLQVNNRREGDELVGTDGEANLTSRRGEKKRRK